MSASASSPVQLLRATRHLVSQGSHRQCFWTAASPWLSGHSHWATIKHDKAKADAKKQKERAALLGALAAASRRFGPDADLNSSLALAIRNAKKASVPKSSIDAAIARGQGRSSTGAPLETLTIEAVIPPVAVIAEFRTESRARTLQELRTVIKESDAQQAPTAYLFEKRGRIVFEGKEGIGVDEVLETAIDAGALDVSTDERGSIVIDTEWNDLKAVEKMVGDRFELSADSSEIVWTPNPDTMVGSAGMDVKEKIERLRNGFLEHPEALGVSTNLIRAL